MADVSVFKSMAHGGEADSLQEELLLDMCVGWRQGGTNHLWIGLLQIRWWWASAHNEAQNAFVVGYAPLGLRGFDWRPCARFVAAFAAALCSLQVTGTFLLILSYLPSVLQCARSSRPHFACSGSCKNCFCGQDER